MMVEERNPCCRTKYVVVYAIQIRRYYALCYTCTAGIVFSGELLKFIRTFSTAHTAELTPFYVRVQLTAALQ